MRPIGAVMAVLFLSLGACEKHQEVPPVAALFGAKPGDGGWTVTLSSAKFKAGKVSLAPDDEATIGKIAELLKANLQLRILIEDYADEHGSRTHTQRLSQEHANAVLRDLTSMGVGVEFIFSNAGGEFRPAPVENS
jgi:outer membrane protein OmpA-like peptidoglycan-associated protein